MWQSERSRVCEQKEAEWEARGDRIGAQLDEASRINKLTIGDRLEAKQKARQARENKINIPSFTPREASVLQLVAEGLMNKEIARQLETSIRNVEKYVSRLFIKTGTSSRTELVRYALENHLVK